MPRPSYSFVLVLSASFVLLVPKAAIPDEAEITSPTGTITLAYPLEPRGTYTSGTPRNWTSEIELDYDSLPDVTTTDLACNRSGVAWFTDNESPKGEADEFIFPAGEGEYTARVYDGTTLLDVSTGRMDDPAT